MCSAHSPPSLVQVFAERHDWASRATAFKVLSRRDPVFTEGLLGSLQGQGNAPQQHPCRLFRGSRPCQSTGVSRVPAPPCEMPPALAGKALTSGKKTREKTNQSRNYTWAKQPRLRPRAQTSSMSNSQCMPPGTLALWDGEP